MSRAPRSLGEISKATTAVDCQLSLDDTIGELLRILAASKVGGVFLQLGRGAPEAGAWLLDGMDITSKLVVVAEEPRLVPIIEETLGNDIRVAVHVQDALEFIDDIRSHQLHFLIFDTGSVEKELIMGAVELLVPGGLLVILISDMAHSDSRALFEWLRQAPQLRTACLKEAVMVATRCPVRDKPIRRGARRMRRRRVGNNTQRL